LGDSIRGKIISLTILNEFSKNLGLNRKELLRKLFSNPVEKLMVVKKPIAI